jgi:ABC-2 type transport system ATP-binding protein
LDSSFDVGRGEVFGFLGPNGAGKTTTVRTLGTLLEPGSGSDTLSGIPLRPENGGETRRRIVIMLGWWVASVLFDRERLLIR